MQRKYKFETFGGKENKANKRNFKLEEKRKCIVFFYVAWEFG